MPLTTAQQVRLKIQDQPLIADITYIGDGSATIYPLPHRNVSSGTAYIGATGGWASTGAAFDASGFVAFSGVISANSAWRARYVHSTFSDEEVDHFITAGGDVNGAALEAVGALMFDGLRRAKWASPDGTEYDDTAAMKLLSELYDRLEKERGEMAVLSGGIVGWSEEQGNW